MPQAMPVASAKMIWLDSGHVRSSATLAAAIAALFSCAPPSLAHTADDREFEEADRLAGGGERRESG